MFSDEEILQFAKQRNPVATSGDVAAFRRMMVRFNCEDSETVAEAHDRIAAAMEKSFSNEETVGE